MNLFLKPGPLDFSGSPGGSGHLDKKRFTDIEKAINQLLNEMFPRWGMNMNELIGKTHKWKSITRFFRVTLFGGFKWPFQGLNDLYLGDQRVTWKKLVVYPEIGRQPWITSEDG